MTGWIIAGIVVLLLVGIMLIRLRLVIMLDDSFVLRLKILCFTFHIVPSEAKKEKINLRDYEIKRVRKKAAEAQKKLRKKALRAAAKQKKNKKALNDAEEAKEKTDIPSMLKIILSILTDIRNAALGYIGIDLEQFYINVSSDDASNTAILYGAVSQSANLLFEFLRNTTGFRMTGKAEDIAVIPDFSFGTITVRLKLMVCIRVWQIFALAFKLFVPFIKFQIKNNKTIVTAEEEQHG